MDKFNYQILNNHIIINISNKQFLLDTGSPTSFWTYEPINKIQINKKDYRLTPKPVSVNLREVEKLVGIKVDGFIGLDIIGDTSLTIYKNGEIKFGVDDINGTSTKLFSNGYLSIQVGSNLIVGKMLLDTGAKYGYGIKSLFYNQKSFARVNDYNPQLGNLESDIYHLDVVIGGANKVIDVCDNDEVSFNYLKPTNSILVANITSLFDEVCVIDISNGLFIFK